MANSIQETLIAQTIKAVQELYSADIPESQVTLQETRKEFEGHITVVVFPVTRFSRKSPEQTGTGDFLEKRVTGKTTTVICPSNSFREHVFPESHRSKQEPRLGNSSSTTFRPYLLSM